MGYRKGERIKERCERVVKRRNKRQKKKRVKSFTGRLGALIMCCKYKRVRKIEWEEWKGNSIKSFEENDEIVSVYA